VHDPPLVRPTYFFGYWAYTRRGQSFTWSVVDLNDLGLISYPPTRNASWSVLLLQKPCIKIIWILNYWAVLSAFAWLFHDVASVCEVIWCEMWCRRLLCVSQCPVFTVGSLCCTVSWQPKYPNYDLEEGGGSSSEVPVIFTVFDTDNEWVMIKAENLIANVEWRWIFGHSQNSGSENFNFGYRQCTYKVMLRRVHVSVVAGRK
jgi:hypothetical protein